MSTTTNRRGVRAALFTLAIAGAPSALAAQAPTFASRAARLGDAVIAADLARFDSLGAALAHDAASPLGAARATMLVGLAREAYERNDDGALTARLVRDAREAASTVPASGPRVVAEPGDSLLDAAWRAPLTADRIGDVVALEAATRRARSPLLGAPECGAWEARAVQIASRLLALSKVRSSTAVVAAITPDVEVAPAPAAPPAALVAPDTLRGVPGGVHFALDRADLAPASRRMLDSLAVAVARYPDVRIVLGGHTDRRGSVAYNVALSGRRAAAVRAYLATRGVDASRIAVEALASTRPAATGDGVRDLARNRRVSVRYLTGDGREIPTVEPLDDLQVEPERAAPHRR